LRFLASGRQGGRRGLLLAMRSRRLTLLRAGAARALLRFFALAVELFLFALSSSRAPFVFRVCVCCAPAFAGALCNSYFVFCDFVRSYVDIYIYIYEVVHNQKEFSCSELNFVVAVLYYFEFFCSIVYNRSYIF
jgi:hypothetical protein